MKPAAAKRSAAVLRAEVAKRAVIPEAEDKKAASIVVVEAEQERLR